MYLNKFMVLDKYPLISACEYVAIQLMYSAISMVASYKSLKIPSNSIAEGLIFQNSLEGHAFRPLELACFACKHALHTI